MGASARHWRALGYGSALGLWVAAVTHTVAVTRVRAPEEPPAGRDTTAFLRAYLAHRADLFEYQQVESWALAAAMLGTGVLAGVWRATLTHPPGRGSGRLSSGLVMIGAMVIGAAQVAYVGGMDRVLPDVAITWYEPAAQAMLVEVIAGSAVYVQSVALVLIAVGVWGMGWVGPLVWGAARRSGLLTVALTLGLLAMAVTGFVGSPASDVLLLVVVGALGPLWAIDLSRAIDGTTPRLAGPVRR